MNTKKKLSSHRVMTTMLLAIILCCPLNAATLHYTLNTNNHTAELVYDSSYPASLSGDLVIPASVFYDYYDYTVTSIGEGAFKNCSKLTSVTIPNSVTTIGNEAFNDCYGLTSVTIGNSVTSIGNHAFDGCMGLTSVEIPNSVYSIGSDAFCGCSGLTSLVIPDGVYSIGNTAFQNCSGLTSVTIGNSVQSIGQSPFISCYNIESLIINNESCAKISYFSYSQASLKTLVLGGYVTTIDYNAFSGCSGLTSVSIGNSVTTIGRNAFSGCSGLTSVTIPNSVTTIGRAAFYGCSGLTSVTIGNSVTTIGNEAFRECSSLTSVTIPNSVTGIGGAAFYGCAGLKSVSIGNSVTTIYNHVFSCCSSLESIVVDGGNTNYDSRDNCNAIIETATNTLLYGCKNTTIPYTVTRIGAYAFFKCSGLTSVTIPNWVYSIGNSAFGGCSSLESIVVDGGNTNYDSRDNCNAIIETATNTLINGCKNTAIPNSVTSIGEDAFYNCSGLTSVTIPNSVTSIGGYAFCNCSSLTEIFSKIVDVSEVSLDSSVFSGVPTYCVLYVPIGTSSAYKQADQWKDFNYIQEAIIGKSATVGDLNVDNVVDGTDLNIMTNQLLHTSTYLDDDGACDLNDDGRVNGLDINKMIGIILVEE